MRDLVTIDSHANPAGGSTRRASGAGPVGWARACNAPAHDRRHERLPGPPCGTAASLDDYDLVTVVLRERRTSATPSRIGGASAVSGLAHDGTASAARRLALFQVASALGRSPTMMSVMLPDEFPIKEEPRSETALSIRRHLRARPTLASGPGRSLARVWASRPLSQIVAQAGERLARSPSSSAAVPACVSCPPDAPAWILAQTILADERNALVRQCVSFRVHADRGCAFYVHGEPLAADHHGPVRGARGITSGRFSLESGRGEPALPPSSSRGEIDMLVSTELFETCRAPWTCTICAAGNCDLVARPSRGHRPPGLAASRPRSSARRTLRECTRLSYAISRGSASPRSGNSAAAPYPRTDAGDRGCAGRGWALLAPARRSGPARSAGCLVSIGAVPG